MGVPAVHTETPRLSSEFVEADLGDERLNRRLGLLVDSLAERSAESFPKALDDAELEAAYRFFGNEQVTPEAILAPHFRQSAHRAAQLSQIIVSHDTTQFEFAGQKKRRGLGHLIRPGAQGFFGHFSLAMSVKEEELRRGGGIVAMGRQQRAAAGTKNAEIVFPDAQLACTMTATEQILWAHHVDKSEEVKAGATIQAFADLLPASDGTAPFAIHTFLQIVGDQETKPQLAAIANDHFVFTGKSADEKQTPISREFAATRTTSSSRATAGLGARGVGELTDCTIREREPARDWSASTPALVAVSDPSDSAVCSS